ncbi:hypothetical protein ACFLSQ_09730 [Bacteroidota bacterium]
MNSNIPNKKISYSEMQEMLCDYAFNKLPDEERQVFENTLPEYPDLKQEIKEIRSAFEKVEAIDFNKNISRHTRNLSVKVNQRLARETQIPNGFRILNKFLIPAAGLAVLIVMVFTGTLNLDFLNPNENIGIVQTSSKTKNFTGITTAEASTIFDKEVENSDIIEITQLLPKGLGDENIDILSGLDTDLLETGYNGLVEEVFAGNILAQVEDLNALENATQYDLYDNLEDLNEDDILYILEELENADFNS